MVDGIHGGDQASPEGSSAAMESRLREHYLAHCGKTLGGGQVGDTTGDTQGRANPLQGEELMKHVDGPGGLPLPHALHLRTGGSQSKAASLRLILISPNTFYVLTQYIYSLYK